MPDIAKVNPPNCRGIDLDDSHFWWNAVQGEDGWYVSALLSRPGMCIYVLQDQGPFRTRGHANRYAIGEAIEVLPREFTPCHE